MHSETKSSGNFIADKGTTRTHGPRIIKDLSKSYLGPLPFSAQVSNIWDDRQDPNTFPQLCLTKVQTNDNICTVTTYSMFHN